MNVIKCNIKTMEDLYQLSFIELGKFSKKPSSKQWNIVAREKNLMNYVAIKSYAKMDFTSLYRLSRNNFKLINFR